MKEWYKYWFKTGVFWKALGRVWIAAMLTLAAAFVPLYIWRGSYYGDTGTSLLVEDILMSVIGIVGGFIILMLIQSRREDILDWPKEEVVLDAAGGVGLYLALWIFCGITLRNNYIVAFCGYHFSNLLIERLNFEPERLAFVLSALVYGPVYFAALLAGRKWAQLRARWTCRGLKNREE